MAIFYLGHYYNNINNIIIMPFEINQMNFLSKNTFI